MKLRGDTEKYILRQLGKRIVPPQILKREKFGWFAPGSPDMLQQGVEWINDALSPTTIKRHGYFDPDVIETLRAQYSRPGFKLSQPFETDWLIVIATFALFKEVFRVPDLS